ncbi:hypothetical protein BDZ89DRAFT_543505 [Hymenopellis radicata]|nr:hypothetical protein BDZ89DRAFT_543505 [Hymenopellis radicata]
MALNVAEQIAPLDWINALSHDPTVSELLNHNDPPSPLQTPVICEYLHSLSLPQQKLNAVIEVLERSLDLLRDRACLLDTMHTQYTGFLSPVRRLPSEILARILGYLSLHSELRRAMHVCRRWFAVGDALCSHIWSHITDTIFHDGDESNLLSRLSVALRRAHEYPLALRLLPSWSYSPSRGHVRNQYIAHAACQLLRSRAEQWDSLEIVLENSTDIAWIHGRFQRL